MPRHSSRDGLIPPARFVSSADRPRYPDDLRAEDRARFDALTASFDPCADPCMSAPAGEQGGSEPARDEAQPRGAVDEPAGEHPPRRDSLGLGADAGAVVDRLRAQVGLQYARALGRRRTGGKVAQDAGQQLTDRPRLTSRRSR